MKLFVYRAVLAVALFGADTAFAAERTVTLKVERMTCASCPYIVKRSLTRLDGVKEVSVTFETASAVVTFDDEKVSPEALVNATLGAGFPSRLKSR